MNRARFIERLTEVRRTTEQLLAELQASEHDKFAAHLYRSRREYRSACERAGKGGKNIERCVISTFRFAKAWDSKASFATGRNFCGLVTRKAHLLEERPTSLFVRLKLRCGQFFSPTTHQSGSISSVNTSVLTFMKFDNTAKRCAHGL